ncbi:hypothetical protein N9J16_00655 [Candidatus Poseidoniaceae archaeon]|nr:hypothetical protein [Candidatus Poseidoniaceae archaeon]
MAEDNYSRFGIKGMIEDIGTVNDEKAASLIRELQIPQKIQKILNDGVMEVRINLPANINNKSPSDNYYGNGTWEHVFDKFTALLKEEGLLVYFTHQGRGGCCRVPTEDKTRVKCRFCSHWGDQYSSCSNCDRLGWKSVGYHPCGKCKKLFRKSKEKVYDSILIKIKP